MKREKGKVIFNVSFSVRDIERGRKRRRKKEMNRPIIIVARRGTINRQSKEFYPSAWIRVSLNENSFNIYYKAFVIHRESLAAYGPRGHR